MTKIGTTFTKSGKKAVLCGSGELGKEVALELQRYGVEVVALDKYANAPAMHVAHRSHVLSMLDGEALETVIREENPDYIIPEIEAIATDMVVARPHNVTTEQRDVRPDNSFSIHTPPYLNYFAKVMRGNLVSGRNGRAGCLFTPR